MKEFYVGWWNVENLFDSINVERTEKLRRVIGRELKGWNTEVLNKKMAQLSKIISLMNNGKGPDILGVCEIESKAVLEKLVSEIPLQRNYSVAHENTKDRRGIDTAFIYDADLFEKGEVFSHYIIKRSSTRDLFQVNLTIKGSDQLLVLIGNHWPSRMNGQFESEPYRIIAGETLAYFHQRIVEIHGKDVPIIAMGDFNDDPFSRSITEYALSTNSKSKVRNARKNPKFYNLMWPLLAGGAGTHYYRGGSIIDQIMVSNGLLPNRSRVSIREGSIKIENFPAMAKNGKPRRFGRPSKKYDEGGFSDHFPTSVMVEFDDAAET